MVSDLNPENDFISETITISGDTSAYVINVPSQEINLFDTLTMHITTNNTGNNVAAGMYIYQIKSGSYNETKKMILLK